MSLTQSHRVTENPLPTHLILTDVTQLRLLPHSLQTQLELAATFRAQQVALRATHGRRAPLARRRRRPLLDIRVGLGHHLLVQDAVLEAQLDLAARGRGRGRRAAQMLAGAAQVDVGEVHEAEGVRVRAQGDALALLRLVVACVACVVVVVVCGGCGGCGGGVACGGLGKQDGLQKVWLKCLWRRQKEETVK